MKAATASARVERVRYLLNSYQKYYNEARTHLSLHKDAPIPRAVHTVGRTLAVPVLGRTAPSIFQGVSFLRVFVIPRPNRKPTLAAAMRGGLRRKLDPRSLPW
jgi:hypothetical protein